MRTGYLAVLGAVVAGCFGVLAAEDIKVPYPEGYRNWTLLHASVIGSKAASFALPCESPCTAGIFYFYGNEKAMAGFRNGGSYADGAVIGEELLEMHGKENGSAKEGPRRMVAVMVRDSKRYASTGGWGYGQWDGVTKADLLDEAGRDACYQCHVGRKDQGYVFTEYRER